MSNGTIAVFMNEEGVPASLASARKLCVYEKDNDTWSDVQEIYVKFGIISDITELRGEVQKLAAKLGDCRIAAGNRMSGIIFRELGHHGFSIFEIDDISPSIFDGILQDTREAEQSDNSTVVLQPVETDTPGVFTFDLIGYQQQFPERSSKQALKEFLQQTPFYELKLTCSHLPPWLEEAYQTDIDNSEDGNITATIRKKQCRSY